MTYTPKGNEYARALDAVISEIDRYDPAAFPRQAVRNLRPGLIEEFSAGQWPDEEDRNAIESALMWEKGDLEWIARGGAPSKTDRDHRFWRVTVVVEYEVEAPSGEEAISSLTEPIRETLGGGEIGIVEANATNKALLKRRAEEAEQRRYGGMK